MGSGYLLGQGVGGGGGGLVGLPVTKLRYRTLQDESWPLSRSLGGFSNKIIILLLFTKTRCASGCPLNSVLKGRRSKDMVF